MANRLRLKDTTSEDLLQNITPTVFMTFKISLVLHVFQVLLRPILVYQAHQIGLIQLSTPKNGQAPN